MFASNVFVSDCAAIIGRQVGNVAYLTRSLYPHRPQIRLFAATFYNSTSADTPLTTFTVTLGVFPFTARTMPIFRLPPNVS